MNTITNPINNKFIQILKIIGLSLLIIMIIFIASVEFFPDNSFAGNPKDLSFLDKAAAKLKKIGVFDLIFGEINFRTSKEHQEALGIETAKISGAEEKKLDSMIDESIKAQLEYYSMENNESFEKVKNLYLPYGFEQYKEYVKREAGYDDDTRSKSQRYDKIEQVKFSKPRTYKVLPDRIGIMNLVKFKGEYINVLEQVFIFININGDWKIEKQREIATITNLDENMLIQEIKDRK